MEWQPIETAPQDGTPILAYFKSAIQHVPGIISVAKKKEHYWVLECYAEHQCSVPTHWMPLPPPPLGAEQ